MTSRVPRPDTEVMAERILMIDDDSRLARMVSDYLGGAGFRLTIAGTARDGEALLKRETFAPSSSPHSADAEGRFCAACACQRPSDPELTARGEPIDRVIGLRSAPRLSRKPSSRAAAGAAARHPAPPGRCRAKANAGSASRFDRGARGARRRREPHHLLQFAILIDLAERAGRVLSRYALWTSERRELEPSTLGRVTSRASAPPSRTMPGSHAAADDPGAGYVLPRPWQC